MRWREVDKLRKLAKRGIFDFKAGYPIFQVRRTDGATFEFDNFLPRVKKLGRLLEQKTIKHLWPRALDEFEAGRHLDFGKLSVSREGLHIGKEVIPWNHVKDVTLDAKEKELLIGRTQGRPWTRYPIGDIPNFHVLLVLFEHVSGT